MKIYLIVLSLFISSCIGKSEPKQLKVVEKTDQIPSIKAQKQKTYYFTDALTYEIDQNGEKTELWFYVNTKTNQILHLPNDDMIKGVISFPDGNYKIYGNTEFERDTILSDFISDVLSNDDFSGVAKAMSSTKTINQENIQQKPIFSKGYRIDYEQMQGGEDIYVTTQIPINSRQIYGFCRLNGDAKLNPIFDYLNVLNHNQTITHVEKDGYTVRLLNFGPNPYELTVKE